MCNQYCQLAISIVRSWSACPCHWQSYFLVDRASFFSLFTTTPSNRIKNTVRAGLPASGCKCADTLAGKSAALKTAPIMPAMNALQQRPDSSLGREMNLEVRGFWSMIISKRIEVSRPQSEQNSRMHTFVGVFVAFFQRVGCPVKNCAVKGIVHVIKNIE